VYVPTIENIIKDQITLKECSISIGRMFVHNFERTLTERIA